MCHRIKLTIGVLALMIVLSPAQVGSESRSTSEKPLTRCFDLLGTEDHVGSMQTGTITATGHCIGSERSCGIGVFQGS